MGRVRWRLEQRRLDRVQREFAGQPKPRGIWLDVVLVLVAVAAGMLVLFHAASSPAENQRPQPAPVTASLTP